MCFPLAIGVAVGAGIAAAEAAGAATATVGAVITAAIEGGIIAGVEGEALLIAGMGLQCLLGPVAGGIATDILGVAGAVAGGAIGGLGGEAEGTFETSTFDASGEMLGAPIVHAPSSLAAMSGGEFSQATAEHLLGSMLDLGGDSLPSQLGTLAPDGSLAGTIPSQSSQYLAMAPSAPPDEMADVQGALSEQGGAEASAPGRIVGKGLLLPGGNIEAPIQLPDSGITTLGGVAQGRTPPGVLALGDGGGLYDSAPATMPAPSLPGAPGGAVSHLVEASAGPAPNALGGSPAAAAAAGAVITAQLQALGVPLPTAAGRGVVAPRLPPAPRPAPRTPIDLRSPSPYIFLQPADDVPALPPESLFHTLPVDADGGIDLAKLGVPGPPPPKVRVPAADPEANLPRVPTPFNTPATRLPHQEWDYLQPIDSTPDYRPLYGPTLGGIDTALVSAGAGWGNVAIGLVNSLSVLVHLPGYAGRNYLGLSSTDVDFLSDFSAAPEVVAGAPAHLLADAITGARQSTEIALANRVSSIPGPVVPGSGPIIRGTVGAASRAEALARRLKLNPDSAYTRQVLNSLDDKVSTFIGKYRLGSIVRVKGTPPIPWDKVLEMTVEEAIQFNKSVRKLLIDGRFAK